MSFDEGIEILVIAGAVGINIFHAGHKLVIGAVRPLTHRRSSGWKPAMEKKTAVLGRCENESAGRFDQ